MLLYTCVFRKQAGSLGHPCGKAAKALDRAGHEYEIKVVGGNRLMPWTWNSREEDRAEVRQLSGANEVPILVLDDGEVIAGSATIARWATRQPARDRGPDAGR
jgi:glutathione S-transferase